MKPETWLYLPPLYCALAIGGIILSMTSPAPAEVTFKRVKVENRPLGKRINVQIKPDESYYHKDNKPTSSTVSTQPAVPNKPKNTDEWFWNGFDHKVETASLSRWIAAEEQLLKSPKKAQHLTPSLSAMRKLAQDHGTSILLATLDKNVSPAFILSVIAVESAGKVDAVSSAGAQGLMQLIPATAERFKVKDSTDPKQNIAGGVAYLSWLFREFNNDPVLALAGYNAGENAVKEYQSVPPFAETRHYIPKVVAAWNVAKALCKTPPKFVTDGCVFGLHNKS